MSLIEPANDSAKALLPRSSILEDQFSIRSFSDLDHRSLFTRDAIVVASSTYMVSPADPAFVRFSGVMPWPRLVPVEVLGLRLGGSKRRVSLLDVAVTVQMRAFCSFSPQGVYPSLRPLRSPRR